MAVNYLQKGDNLTLVAPTGGVTKGVGVLIGDLFVVAHNTALVTETFTGATEGVWRLAKTSTDVWVVGDKIYWDNANSRCTNAPTGATRFIGKAVAAAANPTSTGDVCLMPGFATTSAGAGGAPVSDATAGARTWTAAEILVGTIVRDCNGASRSDVLPTAALLVAALPGCRVGDLINCLMINGSDAAETITVGAGTGGGFDTNQTSASRVIGQNNSKMMRIRLTNVTASSEAYVVYL